MTLRKNAIDHIRETWQVSVNRYRASDSMDEQLVHYGAMKACEEMLERLGAVKMRDIDHIILNEDIRRKIDVLQLQRADTTTIVRAGNR